MKFLRTSMKTWGKLLKNPTDADALCNIIQDPSFPPPVLITWHLSVLRHCSKLFWSASVTTHQRSYLVISYHIRNSQVKIIVKSSVCSKCVTLYTDYYVFNLDMKQFGILKYCITCKSYHVLSLTFLVMHYYQTNTFSSTNEYRVQEGRCVLAGCHTPTHIT